MNGEKNLIWHQGFVSRLDRQKLFGHRARTLWLTGLSGSGKSTIAMALEAHLLDVGCICYVLDGDNVRQGLNRDLGFSPESRKENIRRVAEVARLMNDAGLIVMTAFISPYRADREMAREIIGAECFSEVYLSTPLSMCEERDPKGFYVRARQGGIAEFTGINAPYETPLNPSVVLDTSGRSVADSVARVLVALGLPTAKG